MVFMLFSGEFAERAELYFPSIRGEKASVTKQAPITRKQYLLFDELAKNNGIYRIRVQSKLNPATSTTDSNDAVWLYSYTYAVGIKMILQYCYFKNISNLFLL